MQAAEIELPDCPDAVVKRLIAELGLSAITAQVLARRGYAEPEAAAAFLAAEEFHAPSAFAGMEDAVALILERVREGAPITVHGDYDVDGVCATAILLRPLRALGAQVDSYIPDRAGDGYGLATATVSRLAAAGTRLLITVDCGISAAEQVAQAQAAGMEVLITDHHAPPAGALPAAPILHPKLCAYPFEHLCGAAVAYKLALALAERSGSGGLRRQVESDLDLVALASIADSVPLIGENRSLVRAGMRALTQTAKPGLRALIAQAKIDPGRLDERSVGFGLAPRINAAGRLYRADAALELLQCGDQQRAAQIAAELDRANSERRQEEAIVLQQAQAQVAALPDQPAYVLAGEGWHPGVIGIVASRIVEQVHRPALLISLDGERGRGSGRSIEGFDLLAGLQSCAGSLERFGGHRAAAGLEVSRSRLQDFGREFLNFAAERFAEAQPVRRLRADALVGVGELSMAIAEELQALAPFGQGNRAPALLISGLRIADIRGMGEGKHVRCSVQQSGAKLNCVGFGCGARRDFVAEHPEAALHDGLFRLEINEWRGAREARLGLIHLQAHSGWSELSGGAASIPYPVEEDGRRDLTLTH